MATSISILPSCAIAAEIGAVHQLDICRSARKVDLHNLASMALSQVVVLEIQSVFLSLCLNILNQRAWHDAMPAALESSSAYAITAIAFDEKRRANQNLITLMTHADANVHCVAAT